MVFHEEFDCNPIVRFLRSDVGSLQDAKFHIKLTRDMCTRYIKFKKFYYTQCCLIKYIQLYNETIFLT